MMNGQIPAFGDWENVNQLPITQYFECARQAGLLRCSCSSRHEFPPLTRGTNRGGPRVKKPMKKIKVSYMMDLPTHQPLPPKHHSNKLGEFISHQSARAVKPVDEDLYKIPSELLENSKRIGRVKFKHESL